MKILLFEETDKHEYPIESKIANAARIYLQKDIKVTNTREQALSELENEKFDLVFIHHYDFQDVFHFRKQAPETKFIGYHGGRELDEQDQEITYAPGTIGYEVAKKLMVRYDHVISNSVIKLHELFTQLRDERDSALHNFGKN